MSQTRTTNINGMDVKQIFEVFRLDAVARKMGKSRAWLSQKVNNSIDHGKRVEFKPEEFEALKKAIRELSVEMITNCDKIKLDEKDRS
jgi:hypothetical protein